MFDTTTLEALVDGDPAEFRRFALMFLDSFGTALAHMEIARASHDLAALGAMGHRAKTTARNIGAVALGDACELLETLAQASNFDAAERVAAGLGPLFEGVRATLTRRFDPLQDGL